MKFRYWEQVLVKDHPSLHSFYHPATIYRVINFRPKAAGERVYLIQPEGTPNKYKVKESNLESLEVKEWPVG